MSGATSQSFIDAFRNTGAIACGFALSEEWHPIALFGEWGS